jgi:hypothetical protein
MVCWMLPIGNIILLRVQFLQGVSDHHGRSLVMQLVFSAVHVAALTRISRSQFALDLLSFNPERVTNIVPPF